jgi:hypothetical protein
MLDIKPKTDKKICTSCWPREVVLAKWAYSGRKERKEDDYFCEMHAQAGSMIDSDPGHWRVLDPQETQSA